ncbi:hypothetical protein V6N13_149461 [Hibiscus sabdariffa]
MFIFRSDNTGYFSLNSRATNIDFGEVTKKLLKIQGERTVQPSRKFLFLWISNHYIVASNKFRTYNPIGIVIAIAGVDEPFLDKDPNGGHSWELERRISTFDWP